MPLTSNAVRSPNSGGKLWSTIGLPRSMCRGYQSTPCQIGVAGYSPHLQCSEVPKLGGDALVHLRLAPQHVPGLLGVAEGDAADVDPSALHELPRAHLPFLRLGALGKLPGNEGPVEVSVGGLEGHEGVHFAPQFGIVFGRPWNSATGRQKKEI